MRSLQSCRPFKLPRGDDYATAPAGAGHRSRYGCHRGVRGGIVTPDLRGARQPRTRPSHAARRESGRRSRGSGPGASPRRTSGITCGGRLSGRPSHRNRRADISFTLLDRKTGQQISDGDGAPFPIASVVKLFIADDLLLQAAQGQTQLTPDDRQALDVMLRSSDDNAAENFWNRYGGSAIITRVVDRYGLGSTSAPYDGHWWNTMSTTVDLVKYYSMLLDGSGGLPPQQANIMISDLAQSTPTGVDGYPQRFGIPDGLFAESVAVKQGWMCCWNGANWLHMSTGVIGPDRRYVMAIVSLQPVDDATARNTITQTLMTMFPGGQI